MLSTTPILITLDRTRELCFDLNAEIMVRNARAAAADLVTDIGTRRNPKTGTEERALQVNLDNLRRYLWAALARDCRRHDELLTLDQVGELIRHRSQVNTALAAVLAALDAYYGADAGEHTAPAATGRGDGATSR